MENEMVFFTVSCTVFDCKIQLNHLLQLILNMVPKECLKYLQDKGIKTAILPEEKIIDLTYLEKISFSMTLRLTAIFVPIKKF